MYVGLSWNVISREVDVHGTHIKNVHVFTLQWISLKIDYLIDMIFGKKISLTKLRNFWILGLLPSITKNAEDYLLDVHFHLKLCQEEVPLQLQQQLIQIPFTNYLEVKKRVVE